MTRAVLLMTAALASLTSGCGQPPGTAQAPDLEATVEARVQATLSVMAPAASPTAGRQPLPTFAAVPVAVAPPPAPSPSATPAPSATPPSALAPELMVIANTDNEGVFMRETPGGERTTPFSEGTVLTVVGGPREADGQEWLNMEDSTGIVGWIPSIYLRPEAAPETIEESAATASPPLTPSPSPTMDVASLPVATATRVPPSATPAGTSYLLALTSIHGDGGQDYVQVEGEVRNVGDTQLQGVVVIVEFRASDGGLVSRSTASLDRDPLGPGDSSGFRVTIQPGPNIASYRVLFQQQGGENIATLYPATPR